MEMRAWRPPGARHTPGMVAKYALGDEQSLLAKVRYNRLVDIFSGVTCYSLQNHLQTTVRGMGQIETDELTSGSTREAPITRFRSRPRVAGPFHTVVQIEQDIGMWRREVPIADMPTNRRAIHGGRGHRDVRVGGNHNGVRIAAEKHYKLVPPEQVSQADLAAYRERLVGR